jgi:hypothetical protein
MGLGGIQNSPLSFSRINEEASLAKPDFISLFHNLLQRYSRLRLSYRKFLVRAYSQSFNQFLGNYDATPFADT